MADRKRTLDVEDFFRDDKIARGSCSDDEGEAVAAAAPDKPAAHKMQHFDVISCSRRMDVFGSDEIWEQISGMFRRGEALIPNPRYKKQVALVNLRPWDPVSQTGVKVISFWTKNPARFKAAYLADPVFWGQYTIAWNYTLNTAVPELEPGLEASWQQRLDLLRWICSEFTPRSVVLRFDPICTWTDASGRLRDNLAGFEELMQVAGECGVDTVAVAFVRLTPARIKARMVRAGINPVVLPQSEREELIGGLCECAARHRVVLKMCSDAEFDARGVVSKAHCMDGTRFNDLLAAEGREPVAPKFNRKDAGQRPECRCIKTKDVGLYTPCPHSCLYCYASPMAR
jgi:hypothetical protein